MASLALDPSVRFVLAAEPRAALDCEIVETVAVGALIAWRGLNVQVCGTPAFQHKAL